MMRSASLGDLGPWAMASDGVSGPGGWCSTVSSHSRLLDDAWSSPSKVTVTGMPETVPAPPRPHGGRRWRRAERGVHADVHAEVCTDGSHEMAARRGRHRRRARPIQWGEADNAGRLCQDGTGTSATA